MGKKIRAAMAAEKEKFTAGVIANGYSAQLGAQLFEIIEQFADYAFNKSHSYGYGLVAYQTAYLKANHPVEYLASLLTSVKGKLENASVYLNECRLRGIEVQVPDVNRSTSDFRPDREAKGSSGGRIVYGLSAVRNVGEATVERVIAEREKNGPYTSFTDFIDRVDMEVLNKRTVESLIKAGAFDSLGSPRKGLLEVHEPIIDMTLRQRREADAGVMCLFGGSQEEASFDDRPDIPDSEFERMQKLACEKEMLGLYISDHPINGVEAYIARNTDSTIGNLIEANPASEETRYCTIGGVITSLLRRWTRKGELMASFDLEDLQDKIEVIVFPKVMSEFNALLADDAVVIVRGRLERRDDTPRLFASEVRLVEANPQTAPLRIKIPLNLQNRDGLKQLQALLRDHPGDSPVDLHLSDRKVMRLPAEMSVDTGNGLPAELRVLLGASAIVAA